MNNGSLMWIFTFQSRLEMVKLNLIFFCLKLLKGVCVIYLSFGQ